MTVTFFIRGEREYMNIGFKLSDGRGKRWSKSTQIEVQQKYWNEKNQSVKNGGEFSNHVKINDDLLRFEREIRKQYAAAKTDGVYVDNDWMADFVLRFHGQQDASDDSKIYFDAYYHEKWLIANENNQRWNYDREQPVGDSVMNAYENAYKSVLAFDKYRKRRTKLMDMDLNWKNAWTKFMYSGKVPYQYNTIKGVLGCLRTLLKESEVDFYLKVHPDHSNRKYVVLREGEKINRNLPVLTEADLLKLLDLKLDSKTLTRARDWIIIAAYTGLRKSDLFKTLKIEHITAGAKGYVKVTDTIKTGATVTLPLFEPMRQVLYNNDWSLPKTMYGTFSDHLKEVCRLAGMTQIVQDYELIGTGEFDKKGRESFRKGTELVDKPFYKTLTPHSLRRSCASILYGKGISVEVIAGSVGWAALETVELYIQNKDDKLLVTMRKVEDTNEEMIQRAKDFDKDNNVKILANLKIAT